MERSQRTLPQDAVELIGMAIEMASCEKTMRAAIAQVVSPFDLTDNAFFVLVLCHQHLQKPLPQSKLAKKVGLSPAQLSHLVEQLRKDGWIQAERGQSDRRRQYWSLTEDGFSRIETVLHQFRDAWQFDELPVDPHTLVDGLRNLVAILGASLDTKLAPESFVSLSKPHAA